VKRHLLTFTLHQVRKWATSYQDLDVATSSNRLTDDSLEVYWAAPPVPRDVIQEAGGRLVYWEHAFKSRPKLAQFALRNLTAPGT
jgi:hypothetical protein